MDSQSCDESVDLLLDGAYKLGITLTARQKLQFITYCNLVEAANQAFNLTGIKSAAGIMRILFLDSLTLCLAVPPELIESSFQENVRVVDVGSGAGLPGLPLKIVFPHWMLTMLESHRKKASFLKHAVGAMELHKTSVVAERAETVAGLVPFHDTADLCVARAVSSLPSLLELCAPFVKPGGLLLLPKSGDIDAELTSAQNATRTFQLAPRPQVEVPEGLGLGSGRRILVFEKLEPTPPGYPRRVGLAQSRPIA